MRGVGPTASYLLPFLVLVASGLLTGLFAGPIDLLYGLCILLVSLTLYALRGSLVDLAWNWSWLAVSAGVVAAVAYIALAPRPDDNALRAWEAAWGELPDGGRIYWATARAIGSVIVVPLAEELAFRGYLYRRVISSEFTTVPFHRFSFIALVVSSAAFGGTHGGWLAGTITGVLYALVQVRTGSLASAIVAHSVSNAIVAALALGAGQRWLWISPLGYV
jgi:exosortase E/protease (VPEID-CTERM system)